MWIRLLMWAKNFLPLQGCACPVIHKLRHKDKAAALPLIKGLIACKIDVARFRLQCVIASFSGLFIIRLSIVILFYI
jgi:hypothetical protein